MTVWKKNKIPQQTYSKTNIWFYSLASWAVTNPTPLQSRRNTINTNNCMIAALAIDSLQLQLQTHTVEWTAYRTAWSDDIQIEKQKKRCVI